MVGVSVDKFPFLSMIVPVYNARAKYGDILSHNYFLDHQNGTMIYVHHWEDGRVHTY